MKGMGRRDCAPSLLQKLPCKCPHHHIPAILASVGTTHLQGYCPVLPTNSAGVKTCDAMALQYPESNTILGSFPKQNLKWEKQSAEVQTSTILAPGNGQIRVCKSLARLLDSFL